jgi:hypothetical protein
MSKSNAFETALLQLIFNATALNLLAENDTTSPATNIYASLHTGDPGEAGNQSSSEIAYTSYVRKDVIRTSGGWTITGNSCKPVAAITFATGTGGSGTATYFGVGPEASGSTLLLYSGTVTPNIVCGNGVTPSLSTNTEITED